MKTEERLKMWIAVIVRPSLAFYPGTSWDLKDMATNALCEFVSNVQMKSALEEAGYTPLEPKGRIKQRYKLEFVLPYQRIYLELGPWWTDEELTKLYKGMSTKAGRKRVNTKPFLGE